MFEYLNDTGSVIQKVLGVDGVKKVESFLTGQTGRSSVSRFTLKSLSPGLSGAVVLLVSRLGEDGQRKTPLFLKIASDIELINRERNNYISYVHDRWNETPKLLDSSPGMLLYEYGGALANYDPATFRIGYCKSTTEALTGLVKRIVVSLSAFHRLGDDTVNCIERLNFDRSLSEVLKGWTISDDKNNTIVSLWENVKGHPSTSPKVCCTQGHGDLNSGNILFQPGADASMPVFIDFASIVHSKENGGCRIPFWDYAKIERDIKTRMFLAEASAERLTEDEIISAIGNIDSGVQRANPKHSNAIEKLNEVVGALRQEVKKYYPAYAYVGCYRVAVAFATLSILFRKQPDEDIDKDLQARVAVESAIHLLTPEAESYDHAAVQPALFVKVQAGTISGDRFLKERCLSILFKDGYSFFESNEALLEKRMRDLTKKTTLLLFHPDSPHMAAVESMDPHKAQSPGEQRRDCISAIQRMQKIKAKLEGEGDKGLTSRFGFVAYNCVPTWVGYIGEDWLRISIYRTCPYRGHLLTLDTSEQGGTQSTASVYRWFKKDYQDLLDKHRGNTWDLWLYQQPSA